MSAGLYGLVHQPKTPVPVAKDKVSLSHPSGVRDQRPALASAALKVLMLLTTEDGREGERERERWGVGVGEREREIVVFMPASLCSLSACGHR